MSGLGDNDIDRESDVSSLSQITGGDEANKADVNSSEELHVYDAPSLGVDTILSLTTTPVEVKVGASALADRCYFEMQALTKKVKWGYNTSCNFDLFKNQFFSLPAGTDCTVYVKASSGTASVVIAEKS